MRAATIELYSLRMAEAEHTAGPSLPRLLPTCPCASCARMKDKEKSRSAAPIPASVRRSSAEWE